MAHIHITAKPGLHVVVRGRVVDDFKETEHPRKSDGEFAPKGGGQASAKAKPKAATPTTKPSPVEQDAIDEWISGAFYDDKVLNPFMERSPVLGDHKTVYRATSDPRFLKQLRQAAVGDVVSMKSSVISTSESLKAHDEVIRVMEEENGDEGVKSIEIRLPAGKAYGQPVKHSDTSHSEAYQDEFLLKAGTSFRVVTKYPDGDAVLEAIPQEPASAGKITRAKTQEPVAKPKREPAPIKWTKAGGGDFAPHEVERLKSLRVPPAWTNIKLSDDPKAALQVVGRDEKGRAQYLYSAEHSEKAAAEKFARLKAFNGVAGAIMSKAQTDMFNGKTQRVRDTEAVLRLIGETGFRVGSENDTGADVKAHGATTLAAEHVKVDGNDISFDFVGKKGVRITKTINHPELARFIGDKLKTTKTGPLFDTNDMAVRNYMAASGGDGFKVKDFRTWNGTCVALKAIAANPEPTTKAEFTKMRAHVGKVVSAHLGNTPTVALASYIDPAVFLRWSHLQ